MDLNNSRTRKVIYYNDPIIGNENTKSSPNINMNINQLDDVDKNEEEVAGSGKEAHHEENLDGNANLYENVPMGGFIEDLVILRLPGERLGLGLNFEGGWEANELLRRVFIESVNPDSPGSRAQLSWDECTGEAPWKFVQ